MPMKPTLFPSHKINIKIPSGCTWQEQKMVLSECALHLGHTGFLQLKTLYKALRNPILQNTEGKNDRG